METFLNILSSIGIGLIGILFYTLWRSKKFFFNSGYTFSFAVLVKNNLGSWVWALLIILLTAILTMVIPETAEAIATFTGLELQVNKASFFTFGLGLSALTKTKDHG